MNQAAHNFIVVCSIGIPDSKIAFCCLGKPCPFLIPQVCSPNRLITPYLIIFLVSSTLISCYNENQSGSREKLLIIKIYSNAVHHKTLWKYVPFFIYMAILPFTDAVSVFWLHYKMKFPRREVFNPLFMTFLYAAEESIPRLFWPVSRPCVR